MEPGEHRNWSDLYSELLFLIAQRIKCIEDFLSFRDVCVSWKSAADMVNSDENCGFPWLILRTRIDGVNSRQLINLFIGKTYVWKKVPSEIYELGVKGWFLTVSNNGNMNLLHVFSGTRIRLPNKETTGCRETDRIYKAVLSSCPFATRTNYGLVVQIHHYNKSRKMEGETMGFWKSGAGRFAKIRSDSAHYNKITFRNGSVYAVKNNDFLVEFNVSRINRISEKIVSSNGLHVLNCRFYLVESDGELLAVNDVFLVEFGVYKFEGNSWKLINDIGNRSLIVGEDFTSISVDASRIHGCKPNHIYFVANSGLEIMCLYSYSIKDRKITSRVSIQFEGFDANPIFF